MNIQNIIGNNNVFSLFLIVKPIEILPKHNRYGFTSESFALN